MTNTAPTKRTLCRDSWILSRVKVEQNILTIDSLVSCDSNIDCLLIKEDSTDSIWHQTPIYHRYKPQLFTIGSGDIIFNDLLLLLSCVSIYIYDTVLHYDNSTLKQIFKKKQLNVTLEFVNRVYLLPSLDGTFHRTLINLLTLHAPQYC